MYGFSGYATNPYASSRPTLGGPLVRVALRILQSGYSALNILRLRFRRTTLTDPSGNKTNTLEL
jgi:hypothetical protein